MIDTMPTAKLLSVIRSVTKIITYCIPISPREKGFIKGKLNFWVDEAFRGSFSNCKTLLEKNKQNIIDPKEAGGQCDLSEHYSSKLVMTTADPSTPVLHLPPRLSPPPCRSPVPKSRALQPSRGPQCDRTPPGKKMAAVGESGRLAESWRRLRPDTHLTMEAAKREARPGVEARRGPQRQAPRTTREAWRGERIASKQSPRCHPDPSASGPRPGSSILDGK